MRDRSLEEFVEGGADPGEGGDTDSKESGGDGPEERVSADGDATEKPDPDPDREGVEPAVSTFEWAPGSADCARCGAAAERRWRDDDGLVCADCKTW